MMRILNCAFVSISVGIVMCAITCVSHASPPASTTSTPQGKVTEAVSAALAATDFDFFLFDTGSGGVAMAGPPSFAIAWFTIDSGGGMNTDGTFVVSGTIGQPDAGTPMSNGPFQLVGGFWTGGQEPETPCPADVSPSGGGNGQVNVDDLLAVINGWGSCQPPCPPSCEADIAPITSGGDCLVNVDDLLAVINAWGPCLP